MTPVSYPVGMTTEKESEAKRGGHQNRATNNGAFH